MILSNATSSLEAVSFFFFFFFIVINVKNVMLCFAPHGLKRFSTKSSPVDLITWLIEIKVLAILSLRVWFLLLTRPVKEITGNSHHCPYAEAYNFHVSPMGGFRIKFVSVKCGLTLPIRAQTVPPVYL